jgi:hypothetical protein
VRGMGKSVCILDGVHFESLEVMLMCDMDCLGNYSGRVVSDGFRCCRSSQGGMNRIVRRSDTKPGQRLPYIQAFSLLFRTLQDCDYLAITSLRTSKTRGKRAQNLEMRIVAVGFES